MALRLECREVKYQVSISVIEYYDSNAVSRSRKNEICCHHFYKAYQQFEVAPTNTRRSINNETNIVSALNVDKITSANLNK